MGRIVGFSDIGLLFIGVVAAAVLVYMVWPRRIALRPRCRGCGYSVDEYRPERCPECGADLGADGAVRVGPRFGFLPRMLVTVVAAVIALTMFGEFVHRRIVLWRANATVLEYYEFNWQESYTFVNGDEGEVDRTVVLGIHYPVSADFPDASQPEIPDRPWEPWRLSLHVRDELGYQVQGQVESILAPDAVDAAGIGAFLDEAGIGDALAMIEAELGADAFSRDAIAARILHNIRVAEQQDPRGKLKTRAAPPGVPGGSTGVSFGNSYGHQAVRSVPEALWWHRFFEKTWRAVFTAVVCSFLGAWVAGSHARRMRVAGLEPVEE